MKIRNGFVSNSSSSSFICKTNLGVDDVRLALSELLNFYNEWMGKELEFDHVFRDDIEEINGVIPDDVRPYIANWKTGKVNQYLEEKILESTIVFRSAWDNSVPFELWDLIERKFNAYRIHKG